MGDLGLVMDSENMGVKIKKVSFDWKEVNKSELSSCYRVSCKLTTDSGIEIEGSYFYQWYKSGTTLSGPFNWVQAPEANAEVSAFNVALERARQVLPMIIVPNNFNLN